jgi:hypothetical protein
LIIFDLQRQFLDKLTLATTMSRLLFITLTVLAIACKERGIVKASPTLRDTSFRLIDSLGSISIHLPPSADTMLTWVRENDCGRSCEEGKYRFQPKNFPIFLESGFFWDGQPKDSVNQLTISHSRNIQRQRNDNSFVLELRGYFRKNLLSDPETMNIISDTIQKFGDRYFAVFNIEDIDKKSGVYVRRVIAFTSISGNQLQFRYELLTRKQDSTLNGFYQTAIKNLKSVRITDGG